MITFLINYSTVYNFNFITSKLVLDSYSYVNNILITLILISLIFTFHSKGTTVHKVLGLLLLSIFVVFLWILQTQFLFIYLVYILAFISAVLMLFLSVVLMLPISTFNQSSASFKNNIIYLLPILNSIEINVILSFLLLSIILFTLIYSWIITKQTNFSLISLIKCIKSFKLQTLLNRYLTNTYLFSKQFFYNITKISFLKYSKINTFLLIFKYYIKLINIFINNSLIVIIETIIQIVLYCSLFFLVLVPVFIKQNWFSTTIDINFDINLGLGQLKSLLYGDFSLFLVLSTVVLLVALFGAAIMTRTEK